MSTGWWFYYRYGCMDLYELDPNDPDIEEALREEEEARVAEGRLL